MAYQQNQGYYPPQGQQQGYYPPQGQQPYPGNQPYMQQPPPMMQQQGPPPGMSAGQYRAQRAKESGGCMGPCAACCLGACACCALEDLCCLE
ncbi:hypothetical protein OC834_007802, partial [Tilletia horrida]